MHLIEDRNGRSSSHLSLLFFFLIGLLISAGCDRNNSNSSIAPLPATPDTESPTILSISPERDAMDVDLNAVITITFSEPMDPLTINANTIFVTDLAEASPVSGTLQHQGATVTFTPSKDLALSCGYVINIMRDVADLAGNSMGNYDDRSYFWTTREPSHLFLPVEFAWSVSWAEAVAIGDMNNDSRNDIVMVTSDGNDPLNDFRIFVFIQNGAGQLGSPVKYTTAGTSKNAPKTVAVGDMNSDGMMDVVVGHSGLNSSTNSMEVFLQNASGGLDAGVLYPTVNSDKIRIADLNNDGRPDIVGIGWGSNSADVFYQKTDGTLQSAATYSIIHNGFMYDDLAVGDVNNDGLMDIVVMSEWFDDENIGVLQQKPGGGFSDPVYYDIGLVGYSPEFPNGVEVGDVNGDALSDIVLSYGGNQPASNIGVFLQDGTGALELPVSYPSYDNPEPVEIADVNQDGRNDIIVAHGGWFALGVYLQTADGAMGIEERYPLPYASRYNLQGLAVGDVNDDGKNDVVIADYNAGLLVLYHR